MGIFAVHSLYSVFKYNFNKNVCILCLFLHTERGANKHKITYKGTKYFNLLVLSQ